MDATTREPDAVTVKQRARDEPASLWPAGSDAEARLGAIASPKLFPRFTLRRGETIFTAGSCFTREIEAEFVRLGFDVPCSRYEVPEPERPELRPNSVINQYVIPVLRQELLRALSGDLTAACAEALVDVGDGMVVDTQLWAPAPAGRRRATERRQQVMELFSRAFDSEVAVITLGQIENWVDQENGQVLNQMPTRRMIEANPGRFTFRQQQVDDVVGEVEGICHLLTDVGRVDRILLTVSPVPIRRTWVPGDALTNYVAAKSILRVACDVVRTRVPQADYFPSWEMVLLSDRSTVFHPDRIHVRKPVVREIVKRMIDAYVPRGDPDPHAASAS